MEYLENNNTIFNYINKKKTKKNRKKNDVFMVIELEEIGIPDNIANLLIKKKIAKDEKKIIDEYLKEQIKISYDLENFEKHGYESFLNILNFYLYGLENSLIYFRNINAFIKKDIQIKFTLYKNILDSCSRDVIMNDINNIKEFINNLIQDDKINDEDFYSESMSTFSYSSEISKKTDSLERDKDILQIENHNLQKECEKLKEENIKLKKQNEILEKRGILTKSKLYKNMQNLNI